ncbi:hypothetical protein [Bradyrhizobium cenepequi]|uniref:hypothetical protein n=1 Tax=Bradyrhizobium cenepequi TaxID=2821403 RepID=UPI001CE240A4|nr:hypothetical protein [Bradyrhizobium cenepequi]MCA6109490.1 hypothetical protein [Bradyrhizobium cenepequi]
MRYALVATASYLLLVDLVDRVTTPIEEHRREYYGISWFADGTDLVLSHSGLDNQTLVDMVTYAQSEVGWISAGALESGRFLSQPHQILCLTDGKVACTNTGRNAVTIIDLHKPGLFQEARISSSRWHWATRPATISIPSSRAMIGSMSLPTASTRDRSSQYSRFRTCG